MRQTTIIAALALSGMLLFLPSPLTSESPWLEHLWNLGHPIIFFAWTIGLQPALKPFFHQKHFAFIAALLIGSLFIGVAIELIQQVLGRQTSFHDVILNLCGTTIAICVSRMMFNTQLKHPTNLRTALLLTCLGYICYPFVTLATDKATSIHQFPVLADNSTPFELSRFRGNAKASIAQTPSSSENAFKISFDTSLFSITYLDSFPSNWKSYRQLELEIYLAPPSPMTIFFSLADEQHLHNETLYDDRFNAHFLLKPGPNMLSIPLEQAAKAPKERLMNLEEIAKMTLYTSSLSAPRDLYITRIRLIQ